MIFLVFLLLGAIDASAAKYDPDADRAALRAAASASYDETVRAAGLPLVPEKAAAIKAGLGEGVRQARIAENEAKTIETEALRRADEMDAVLGGRGGPAPEAAARDFAAAAAALRERCTKDSGAQADLKKRVDAVPDKKEDGSADPDKKVLKDLLGRAASALSDADAALKTAESAGAAMTDGAARMKSARKASRGPAAERARAAAQVVDGAEGLPEPVSGAEYAVDRLGQEPRQESKARAWAALDPLRDRTRDLLAAADRACNRADEFRARSDDFERGRADFAAAKASGAAAPAAAASSLDQAEKAQAEVQDRLDHPRR